jgi:hypothetical protein
MATEEGLEKLKKELEELRKVQSLNSESRKLEQEISNIKNQIKQEEFRKRNAKLLRVTGSLERGAKRLLSVFFNRKNNAQLGGKSNNKPESNQKVTKSKSQEINDALNTLD